MIKIPLLFLPSLLEELGSFQKEVVDALLSLWILDDALNQLVLKMVSLEVVVDILLFESLQEFLLQKQPKIFVT